MTLFLRPRSTSLENPKFPATQSPTEFPTIYQCDTVDPDANREKQTVVSGLNGTLLRSRSSFPYFMLLAFESPLGWLRFLILLVLSPLVWLLDTCVSEAASLRLLVFVACAGVRVVDIRSAAQAVLPKFYVQDVHPEAWRVFSALGRRYVLTSSPRLMVEPFALQYLEADGVIGTELHILSRFGHRASGFVLPSRCMIGEDKAIALRQYFLDSSKGAGHEHTSEDVLVGLGNGPNDHPFLSLCKEGYIVPRLPKMDALPPSRLPKTLIFHDGRLVKKPTTLCALMTILWLPIGFVLMTLRIIIGLTLPTSMLYYGYKALGIRIIVKGTPPISMKDKKRHGVLFVCTHRTLIDPLIVSCVVRKPVIALTYSLSRLTEVFSPIPTMRLTRNREKDALTICNLLKQGDLAICPEGTTCREPFLLRFSSLFAELTDHIIPVAINCHVGMFNATSARGWKGLDSFYFFLNPSPIYEITFLNNLPQELTCAGGKSPNEVANYIQRTLGATLNFECTNLTRKDKYLTLVGHDGSVSFDQKYSKYTIN